MYKGKNTVISRPSQGQIPSLLVGNSNQNQQQPALPPMLITGTEHQQQLNSHNFHISPDGFSSLYANIYLEIINNISFLNLIIYLKLLIFYSKFIC